jgi:DNA-3-methyladenine glycosylase
MHRLDRAFFRQSAPELAPQLLGKLLCRRLGRRILRLRITETEAYFGEDDTACHASRGCTSRTAIMYGDGGHAYIYLCYGMHEMFNIVTGVEGLPEAVLVRGVTGFAGPGRLTRALRITRTLNQVDLTRSKQLWIEDDGATCGHVAAPRIGIGYAAPRDRDRLWRFIVRRTARPASD